MNNIQSELRCLPQNKIIEHTQIGVDESFMEIDHTQSINESLTDLKIENTGQDNEIIQIVFDTEHTGNDIQPPKIIVTGIKADCDSRTSMRLTGSTQLGFETKKQLSGIDQSDYYECDAPLNFIDSQSDTEPLTYLIENQSDYDSQTSIERSDSTQSDNEIPKELPDVVPSDYESHTILNFIDSPEHDNNAQFTEDLTHRMQPDHESTIEISDIIVLNNDCQSSLDNDIQLSQDIYGQSSQDNENQPSQDSDSQPSEDSNPSQDSDTQADNGTSLQELLFGSNSDNRTEQNLFDSTQDYESTIGISDRTLSNNDGQTSQDNDIQLSQDIDGQSLQDNDNQPSQDNDSQPSEDSNPSQDSNTQPDNGTSLQELLFGSNSDNRTEQNLFDSTQVDRGDHESTIEISDSTLSNSDGHSSQDNDIQLSQDIDSQSSQDNDNQPSPDNDNQPSEDSNPSQDSNTQPDNGTSLQELLFGSDSDNRTEQNLFDSTQVDRGDHESTIEISDSTLSNSDGHSSQDNDIQLSQDIDSQSSQDNDNQPSQDNDSQPSEDSNPSQDSNTQPDNGTSLQELLFSSDSDNRTEQNLFDGTQDDRDHKSTIEISDITLTNNDGKSSQDNDNQPSQDNDSQPSEDSNPSQDSNTQPDNGTSLQELLFSSDSDNRTEQNLFDGTQDDRNHKSTIEISDITLTNNDGKSSQDNDNQPSQDNDSQPSEDSNPSQDSNTQPDNGTSLQELLFSSDSDSRTEQNLFDGTQDDRDHKSTIEISDITLTNSDGHSSQDNDIQLSQDIDSQSPQDNDNQPSQDNDSQPSEDSNNSQDSKTQADNGTSLQELLIGSNSDNRTEQNLFDSTQVDRGDHESTIEISDRTLSNNDGQTSQDNDIQLSQDIDDQSLQDNDNQSSQDNDSQPSEDSNPSQDSNTQADNETSLQELLFGSNSDNRTEQNLFDSTQVDRGDHESTIEISDSTLSNSDGHSSEDNDIQLSQDIHSQSSQDNDNQPSQDNDSQPSEDSNPSQDSNTQADNGTSLQELLIGSNSDNRTEQNLFDSTQVDRGDHESTIEISDSTLSNNDGHSSQDNDIQLSQDIDSQSSQDNDNQPSQDNDSQPSEDSNPSQDSNTQPDNGTSLQELLFGSDSDNRTEQNLFDGTQDDRDHKSTIEISDITLTNNDGKSSQDNDNQPSQDNDSQPSEDSNPSQDSDTHADNGTSLQELLIGSNSDNRTEQNLFDSTQDDPEIFIVIVGSDNDSQSSQKNDTSSNNEISPPERSFATLQMNEDNPSQLISDQTEEETCSRNMLIDSIEAHNDCESPKELNEICPREISVVTNPSVTNSDTDQSNETSTPEMLLVTSQSDKNNETSRELLKGKQINLPAPRKVMLVSKDSENDIDDSKQMSTHKSKDTSTKLEILSSSDSKLVSLTGESDEIPLEDSSDESVVSTRASVMINLNSDTGVEGGDEVSSQESPDKDKTIEETVLENKTTNKEIKSEITSDTENKEAKKQTIPVKLPDPSVPLRRSSRNIKRKRYDIDVGNGDDDSDAEYNVGINDSYRRKPRPIPIGDSRMYMEMASKQFKLNNRNERNDLKPVPGKIPIRPQQYQALSTGMASTSSQAIYNNMVARGTIVTPIPMKINASTSPSPQPILPCLTDDMFVLEAPSFVVPYIYEKPSVKPFREFVDVLGSELAEQRVKAEKEETERREQEKKAKIESGEKVESTDEESPETEDKWRSTEVLNDGTEEDENESQDECQKVEKRDRRKRRNDDDPWYMESLDSEDEVSDNEIERIVIKDEVDAIPDLKEIFNEVPPTANSASARANSYFNSTLGQFVTNLGLNLVQEHVQNDLLRLQTKKLYKEKKLGQNTRLSKKSIVYLKKNLSYSMKNNEPFHFRENKCHICDFKSESSIAISHHLEYPHLVNGMYKCNFCAFEVRSPQEILCHTELKHGVRSRLERPASYHQCPNCPYEDTGKVKLARHAIACEKKFKPKINLAPSPDWEPPAKILKEATRPRHQQTVASSQNAIQRSLPIPIAPAPPRAAMNAMSHSQIAPKFRPAASMPSPRSLSAMDASVIRNGVTLRQAAADATNGKCTPTPNRSQQTSVSITLLPRNHKPTPQPKPQVAGGNIVCEICDGFIKDLDMLRNHIQWVHKVTIHPKMIYNRPPLNCQKCTSRFFTDQGLERHLLGKHGLVTSAMQMSASNNKDAGRCPICGEIYHYKLLTHVAEYHNMKLKPAQLSYKCTVCTATFDVYRHFESHVYSAHSVVARKASDKTALATIKSLRLGDDVTVTPQPLRVLPPAAIARAMQGGHVGTSGSGLTIKRTSK